MSKWVETPYGSQINLGNDHVLAEIERHADRPTSVTIYYRDCPSPEDWDYRSGEKIYHPGYWVLNVYGPNRFFAYYALGDATNMNEELARLVAEEVLYRLIKEQQEVWTTAGLPRPPLILKEQIDRLAAQAEKLGEEN